MGNTVPSLSARGDKNDDLRRFRQTSSSAADIESMKKMKADFLAQVVSSSSSGGTTSNDASSEVSSPMLVKHEKDFSQWRHSSKITSVLCTNDHMFTCSLDKYLVKWSYDDQCCLKVYRGHSKAVTSVFVQQCLNDEVADRSVVYTTSNDCTARAWDVESGECLRVYEGCDNWLSCGVATGQYLLCAGYDCCIYVFDERSGKKLNQLRGHSKRVESLVLSQESGILYSASTDATVRAWDIESGECIHIYTFRDQCTKVALYEPGNLLLCGLHQEIALVDLETNKLLSPILGISSFLSSEELIIGWNSDGKQFSVWDLTRNKFTRSEQLQIAGNMISTPSIGYCNNKLYFVKGTAVVCADFNLNPTVTQSHSTTVRANSFADVPAYVRFPELFNYFTDVILKPSKQIAGSISEASELGLISPDMQLEIQIDLLNTYLENQEQRLARRQEKSARNDTLTSINFQIDVSGYDLDDVEHNGEYSSPVDANIYSPDDHLLDFETRREIFYSKLRPDCEEILQPTVVLVTRSDLVFDACKHFSTFTQSDLRRPMYIFFAGEPALDIGGVTREFYRLLSEQILDQNNALFLKTGVNNTYHPNPTSNVNESHLQYFKFIGKLVGKCIYDRNLMGTHFSRVIFKLMIGKPIVFEDLEYCDPSLFLAMRSILQSDEVEDMYLTFCAELNDFGCNNTLSLVHNGENIPVTNENKEEFVSLYARWKLVESVRTQLTLFLAGLYSIIPRPFFNIFSESELELLLCGSPTISVQDWRQHCRYEAGFTDAHPTILLFWQMVEEMTEIQRSSLLQFVTGTSCVPPEGFRGFYPHFTICCVRAARNSEKNNYLPVAHTCLNRLDFPAYDVVESMDSVGLDVNGLKQMFESAIRHSLLDGFSLH